MKRFGKFLALFFSLYFFRYNCFRFHHFEFSEFFSQGLYLGVFCDLLIAAGIALLSNTFKKTALVLFLIIYFSVISNAVYLDFFKAELSVWIALNNMANVKSVIPSILSFFKASNLRIILSFVFSFISIFLILRKKITPLPKASLALAVLFSGLFSGLLHNETQKSSVTRTPLAHWGIELSKRLLNPVSLETIQKHYSHIDRLDPTNIDQTKVEMPFKNANIIFLFFESFRSYEWLDEDLAQSIFPNLKELSSQNTLEFKQVYSSAFSAGQTVRGNFSVFCSHYPNILGAATYKIQPQTKRRCLQHYLRTEMGYDAGIVLSTKKNYDNKSDFEKNQGSTQIYENDYFSKEFNLDTKGFGIPDIFYYKNITTPIKRFQSPFLIRTINSESHHPYKFNENYSESFSQIKNASKEQKGYWQKLHKAEKALTGFIKEHSKSKEGENTIYVILGDHSVPVSILEKDRHRSTESRFRIPVIFYSPLFKTRTVVNTFTHQVDMAPTLLHILGVDKKPPHFKGKNIFKESSTPWIYKEAGAVHYRDANKICHHHYRKKNGFCALITQEEDPFNKDLIFKETEEKDKVQKINQYIEALQYVIENDLIL